MTLQRKNKPELLAPAGDLEKLQVAITYGADAVYIGGEQFGLRAKSKNFTPAQMMEGIAFAHERGCKVYVTVNIFAHNQDFTHMATYLQDIEKMGVDAIIVADPGVFALARQTVPNMDIHISTQANNTNFHSALFWHNLGAKRVVVARELSLEEIHYTSQHIPPTLELEAFVHGAMCIAYSGRCLLSNYMNDRDANHGACAHACRWQYHLVEKTRPNEYMPVFEDERGTYIYNSKDLCLIHHIPELIHAGIQSFKIEGRMKTAYYVATVVHAYRQAIDDYTSDPMLYEQNKDHYMTEITKASHRQFTTGFSFNKPTNQDQIYTTSAYIRQYDFVGLVLAYDPQTHVATIEQRNKFAVGDTLEVLRAHQPFVHHTVTDLCDDKGIAIDAAPHAQQIVTMIMGQPVAKFDMLRKICIDE